VDPAKVKKNFMLKYLERAQLSYTFGQVIFVHGAITKDNMGNVPQLCAAPWRWGPALIGMGITSLR
jgi:hypothetical protein